MTQSVPPASASPGPFGQRPEHKWISDGSTLNPSPGPLLKRRRDTASGCRDRASEGLLHAVTLARASDRKALQDNAASWTARAEMLDGISATEVASCSAPPPPATTTGE
jgi:hypothetical protein